MILARAQKDSGMDVVRAGIRLPSIGTVIDNGGSPEIKVGDTIHYEWQRSVNITGDIHAVSENHCRAAINGAGPLWQILATPTPRESMRGIFQLSDTAEIEVDNRREVNDPRPVSAIVCAVPRWGFNVPDDAAKVAVSDAMTGKAMYRGQRNWRMPAVGDTVWLGWLGWHFPMRSEAYLWPDAITCVTPADGSAPWCPGDKCLLELIAEDPFTDGGLVKSTDPSTQLSRGYVRLVGEGFAQAHPTIKPGMTVAYRQWGMQNKTCPNPFCDDREFASIVPYQLVAIDSHGPTEEGLVELRAKARDAAALAMSVGIVTGGIDKRDDLNFKFRTDQQDNIHAAAKEHDRLYFGERAQIETL